MALHLASVLFLPLLIGANSKAFLGAKEFKQELQGVLEDVLGQGHGVDAFKLANIEAVLAPMFHALPRNEQGHLSAPVMRYVVQRYFSQRHGWVVRGFEPHAQAVNFSQAEEGGHILQHKLPDAIRTSLEEKFAHNGFALKDTAMMVAAVERLAFDEVIRGVEISFKLNSRSTTRAMSRKMLLDTLRSFLIIEMLEGSVESAEMHQLDKANVHEIYPNWDDADLFLKDVVHNDGFLRNHQRNPFKKQRFTFEDATRVAQQLSEDFGAESSHECSRLKNLLVEMDVHGTGRVKLSDFYGKSIDGKWEFLESTSYLRAIGALDETSALLGPQVIIPNYISGMANCITSSSYYSICCASECDHVFQQLEKELDAPTASVTQIVQAIHKIPSGSNVTEELRFRLQEVAAVHDGHIPIHGRLFAQWIHYVFPHECPYPHVAGTVNPETPLRWEESAGQDASLATEDEIEQYLKSEAARAPPSRDAGKGMWILHESILAKHAPSARTESWLNSLFKRIAQFAMLLAFVLVLKNMVPRFQQIQGAKGKLVEYDV
jgi:hypothetical protein